MDDDKTDSQGKINIEEMKESMIKQIRDSVIRYPYVTSVVNGVHYPMSTPLFLKRGNLGSVVGYRYSYEEAREFADECNAGIREDIQRRELKKQKSANSETLSNRCVDFEAEDA